MTRQPMPRAPASAMSTEGDDAASQELREARERIKELEAVVEQREKKVEQLGNEGRHHDRDHRTVLVRYAYGNTVRYCTVEQEPVVGLG